VLDKEEFKRWIISAQRTLESAKRDYMAKDYSWACFKAQQAVEKALKALLWGIGKPQIGHALKKLVESIEEAGEAGIEIPQDILYNCIELSKYYISTRYPDVWSEGSPEDYFTERVILIVDSPPESPLKRLDIIKDCLLKYPSIEPIIIGLQDYERLKKKNNPIVVEIKRYGVKLL